jgi:NAD(P)-dependent dehydrogenase (short-subunit alcohol dehydrogenase family)
MTGRSLEGLTVLVTGANRGLGAGFVSAALDRGAARVYAAARSPERVPDRDRVVPIRLDLCDPDSIVAAAAQCPDVDLLVSNAGAALPGPAIGPGAADLTTLLRTNVLAPLELVEAFRQGLTARSGGIVFVASVAALVLSRSSPAYSASKAAGMMLALGLRSQLADTGIAISVVYPGFVDTDATAEMRVPKASPSSVAGRSLDGWLAGNVSIFPDRYAEMVRAALGDGLGQAIEDPQSMATDLVKRFRDDARAGQ